MNKLLPALTNRKATHVDNPFFINLAHKQEERTKINAAVLLRPYLFLSCKIDDAADKKGEEGRSDSAFIETGKNYATTDAYPNT